MTNFSPHANQPELVALGQAVRKLRKDRNMTQEDLAHASGVNISYIGMIERGQSNPAWLTLVRLATELGVTVEGIAAEAGM
ncbi:helix-turn-helix domain-containing protein [Duganella hordei]|uniref:helix-turn-helix domain-containing protein n=1 Tax=Duganella hordei TaxID=2865934 RepID=UPI003340B2B6